MRSKSGDTSRNIQSRIARYIRGEISANMITTNSSKMDRSRSSSDQATITTGTAVSVTTAQSSRRGLFGNKFRCKIRPPFRNTVNVKNTSASFLAMMHEMQGMRVAVGASSVPEIGTLCLCEIETVRKIVPKPGFYMQTLTQKLKALHSRNSSK